MMRVNVPQLQKSIASFETIGVVAMDRPDGRHNATSDYVETYWLPIIGPSATWMLRRLVRRLMGRIEFEQPLDELAMELGLGAGTGSNAPVVRTLARLVAFGLAEWDGDTGFLSIAAVVPNISFRQVGRLPKHLRDQHAFDAKGEVSA